MLPNHYNKNQALRYCAPKTSRSDRYNDATVLRCASSTLHLHDKSHRKNQQAEQHVEQLKNIGLINSTTRFHLVGSFYEIYNTMHGSLNIKSERQLLATNLQRSRKARLRRKQLHEPQIAWRMFRATDFMYKRWPNSLTRKPFLSGKMFKSLSWTVQSFNSAIFLPYLHYYDTTPVQLPQLIL
jgi:hypothetical protein